MSPHSIVATYKPRLHGRIAATIDFLSCTVQHFEIIIDDLPRPRDKLTAHSNFRARVKDRTVRTVETAYFFLIAVSVTIIPRSKSGIFILV